MKQKSNIAIQGVKGAYHHVAAEEYFSPEIELTECIAFKDIPEAIREGKSQYGIIAIENSIAGSLLQNHKLLGLHGQKIIGEVYVQIEHCLLANKGVNLDNITDIESHPMALLQCENFLEGHPHIRLVESSDTARSAQKVALSASKTTAAIASELCARIFGLDIIAKNIQTMADNYTRFFVIAPQEMPNDPRADKASLRIVAKHESGSLSKILSVFAIHGINLTKIQSVAIMERPWEYAFYIDVRFPSLRTFESVLEVLSHQTQELEVQGIYKHNNPLTK